MNSRIVSPRAWLAGALLGLAVLAPAGPVLAQVDLARSSIVATGKQLGVPMEGRFRKFAATVNVDPEQLAKSGVTVEIDIASYDIGDATYNKELASKSWFDAARFPKATFVSTAFKPAGPGRFDATGKLTIKGRTQDVSFPFALKTEGGAQVYEGVLPIRRSVFGVGDGDWKDTSVVADEVQIRFRLVAAPAKVK